MQRITVFDSVVLLIALTAPTYVQAQVPPNDDLSNAINVLVFPFSDTVATPDAATLEADEVTCSPFGIFAQSWWYKITPASSGNITITTSGDGTANGISLYDDISLGVYTEISHPLTEVHCQDIDNIGRQGETATINLTAGITYSIRISGIQSKITVPMTTTITFEAAGPPPAPNIAVTPPALDFGTVEVGAFKVDSLMVNNTGGDTLDITGLSLTPAALPFGATLFGPDRIPPGGMTKIHVRFEPGSALVLNDTLWINSNDPYTQVLGVPLAGEGVAPAAPPPATPANAQTGFGTALNTLQEIPAPIIPAGLNPTGTGWFALNIARTELSFHITVTGLSGPISAAHFHEGLFGVAGPPIRGFTAAEIAGNTISGVWTGADAAPLTPERVSQLVNGDIYVNIHTDLNPPGEIRGQVRVKRHVGFTAVLNTTQEIPRPTIPAGLNPSGTGNFGYVLNPAGTVDLGFRITVDALSGPITGAHFHLGAPGEPGGVIRGFTPEEINGNTIKGRWKDTDPAPLTRERRRQLFSDSIYVNIHTTLNGPGEIRGQVQFTTPFNPGPAIANVNVSRRIVPVGAPVRIFAEVTDPDGVISVDAMLMDPNDSLFVPEMFPLFDDGAHEDGLPGDGLWGSDLFFTPPDVPRFFDVSISARDELGQQTHEELIVSFETAFPVEVGAGEEIAGPGGQAVVPIFARDLGNPTEGDKGVVAGEIRLRFAGPVTFLRAFPAPGREFPAGFDFFSPEPGKAVIPHSPY